ncbi:hypothetical protein HY419_01655, partial [candidate division WWE3 bacterium]|nr:hypothetical protein [candidate division WWE3 bacterium]
MDTNKIEIKESLTVFCEQGLNLMRASKDLLHSIGHIERMLNDLNSFLADNPTTKKHINFNILIPAICWHDSWKTTRNSKWALKIILEHI